MAKLHLGHFIDGEWVKTGSEGTFEDVNPADTSQTVATVAAGGPAEVAAAVGAARQALGAWGRTPAPVRAGILKRAGDLLAARKAELARLMTREMGKVLAEAGGDVQEAIDCAYYYFGEGRRMFGQVAPSELPDKYCLSMRRPVGVCGIITPWNFPMAIPAWKIMPALVCGNTVVFKPAPDTPASAVRFVEILEQAGVPRGVVNLVHGGSSVGEAMVAHPDVSLVSFTGSTATGKRIAKACGEQLKRTCLELGGKNAQIVMDDADLDLAVEGALWGAFGTTGQRCTATSRIVVHRKVAEKFTDALVARARRLKIGDGLDADTEVGPLINLAHRERVHQFVEIGRTKDGAELLCGGHPLDGGGRARGAFYAPTVFGGGKPAMTIVREEIFGPVAVVITVKGYAEAIAVVNAARYGLSSAIYTRDVNVAMRAMTDIEAGITYVNGPTIGAEVHMPFGGVKETGNGHREAGIAALDVFSEWKVVYCDYSGKLQKAQIDSRA